MYDEDDEFLNGPKEAPTNSELLRAQIFTVVFLGVLVGIAYIISIILI